MPTPSEHKTVHARILAYAQKIGWTFVPREEAEQRRAGFPTRREDEAGRSAYALLSLFFNDLLDTQVRTFNPRYGDAEGALPGQFCHLHSDIHGNREFLEHLRTRGKFFDHEEKREHDHSQDLFRTLLHELMTAKALVHAVELTPCQVSRG